MNSVTKHIAWVVDDDPLVRETLAIALEESFIVQQACSGEEILECLVTQRNDAQPEPGLVLLDIEMEMLDGYETCQRLRKAGLNMPVIFVSSHDTLDERLLAFEAGGDDFVSKPFDPDIVLLKAQRAFSRHLEARQSKAMKSFLQEANLRVLYEIGEIGVLLAFLRETLRVTDYRTLATALMQAAGDYSITCHVQIRHADGPLTLTPEGEPSALELSILEHAATLGREFRFGQRLILNNDIVSLLVLDMPRDEETARRLAGYLNVLVESAEALAETIEMRRESAARAEEFMVASFENYSTLDDLRSGYRQQQIDTRQLLQELIDDVEKSYLHLGLTDKQETSVSSTLQFNAEKILRLFDLGVHFDRQFAALLDSMKPKRSRAPEVW
jgi:DNA-binding response OmpR family regulator